MQAFHVRRVLLNASLAAMISSFILPAFGQATFTAQLRGTVRDSSGAIIPHAKVTATDSASNVSTATLTDDEGRYIFNGLRPANFTVGVEAQGFKTVQLS